MLWRIAFDPLCFQSMEAAIRRSRLGAYLLQAHSFLSLQRRSPYVNKMKGAGEGVELLPGEGKYLFVYPFTKTRSWYRLSPHARQGMMDEHIAASAPFKGVRLNTSNSYGIDDQDFVVAFDSDYPQEFVDLVGRLRYTEASLYTQRDTPMFACAKAPIRCDPRAVGQHGLATPGLRRAVPPHRQRADRLDRPRERNSCSVRMGSTLDVSSLRS